MRADGLTTELLRDALQSLRAQALRSLLSLLGIVFGVASLVAVSSVSEGTRRELLDQIGALGIDTLSLRVRSGQAKPALLQWDDARALAAVVPGVAAVAPLREARLEAQASARASVVDVAGTTRDYLSAARLSTRRGRFVSALDERSRKRVAVLGAALARELYPWGDALGATLRLGGDWFEIVGVLEGRATRRAQGSSLRSRDTNRTVFVPLSALDHGRGEAQDVDELIVRVRPDQDVRAAAEVARAVMTRRLGGAALDVIVPREILRQRERAQRTFNLSTRLLAGVSLLVGGIGIMNIMLASVAERTAEIGLRRAVGARRRDVALQFLVESTLLASLGGLAGLLLGVAASLLIQAWAGWPIALSAPALLVALLLALVVGVGFGSFPAWRAAQLAPIQALHHE